MTSDDDPMRIPKSETIEKHTGRAMRLGRTTSDGRRAREAKSVADHDEKESVNGTFTGIAEEKEILTIHD